jgi:hypothetical protein
MTEPIVAILQTFKRTDVALRTIAAARQYLHYPDLYWYVADDGSPQAHVEAVLEAVGSLNGHTERRGYGANANTRHGKVPTASARSPFGLKTIGN